MRKERIVALVQKEDALFGSKNGKKKECGERIPCVFGKRKDAFWKRVAKVPSLGFLRWSRREGKSLCVHDIAS